MENETNKVDFANVTTAIKSALEQAETRKKIWIFYIQFQIV
jgi:hypothetical protein